MISWALLRWFPTSTSLVFNESRDLDFSWGFLASRRKNGICLNFLKLPRFTYVHFKQKHWLPLPGSTLAAVTATLCPSGASSLKKNNLSPNKTTEHEFDSASDMGRPKTSFIFQCSTWGRSYWKHWPAVTLSAVLVLFPKPLFTSWANVLTKLRKLHIRTVLWALFPRLNTGRRVFNQTSHHKRKKNLSTRT